MCQGVTHANYKPGFIIFISIEIQEIAFYGLYVQALAGPLELFQQAGAEIDSRYVKSQPRQRDRLKTRTGAEIDRPVIVKLYGAQGGKGYLFLRDAADFEKRIGELGRRDYILQEYVIGVPAYIHYFYSPLTGKLEIMSMDRRYETNVDSLGRIPAEAQKNMSIEPSYVVVGNSPLVLRESMLAEAYRMGEDVVRVSQEICGPKGLFGAFCIETIITPDAKFYVMEISARIVAGTNPFIDGSPYSYLNYSEPMSTGRRIAREIKNALLSNNLHAVLDDSGII